jgi:hypothetical protein
MNINLKKTQIELLKTLINLNRIDPNLVSINQKEYIDIIDRIIKKLKDLDDSTIAIDQKFINGLDPLVKLISGFSKGPVDTDLSHKAKINSILKLNQPNFTDFDLSTMKKTNNIQLQIPKIIQPNINLIEKNNPLQLRISKINVPDINLLESKITEKPLPNLKSNISSVQSDILKPNPFNKLIRYRLDNPKAFIKDDTENIDIKNQIDILTKNISQINKNISIIEQAKRDLLIPINNAKEKIQLYKNTILKPIDDITINNIVNTKTNLSFSSLPNSINEIPDKNDALIINHPLGDYNDDGNIQLGGDLEELPYKSFLSSKLKSLRETYEKINKKKTQVANEFNILYIQFTYYQLFIINKAKQILNQEREAYIYLTYDDFTRYLKKLEYCNYFLKNPDLSNETINIWYFKHYYVIKILFEIFNVIKDIIKEDNYIDLFIDNFKELSILFNMYYDKLDLVSNE